MQTGMIQLNCITFYLLMRAYGQAGKVNKIGGVLQIIENSDVTLDSVCFNCLVDAYGTMGCFVEMKWALEMMEMKGFKPEGYL